MFTALPSPIRKQQQQKRLTDAMYHDELMTRWICVTIYIFLGDMNVPFKLQQSPCCVKLLRSRDMLIFVSGCKGMSALAR